MIAHPMPASGPPALPSDMVEPAVPQGAEPESAIHGPIAGRYDLGDRIARGGMGIVYRAHDRLLNRTVAVKVMRSRFMDRPDLLRRFLAEARINGKLQHPGVVPIYEYGTLTDTRPFIAMKLIEGQTLARYLRERTGPADNLAHYLKVFETLCQTMAYAHRQGVIHRDLKPDNVMVGEFGEVQVMDWGLAKFLDPADAVAATPDGFEAVEKSVYLSGDGCTPVGDHPTEATAIRPVGPDDPGVGYTTAGEVFGTLPYMPPEQARGETDRVDRRGDVFALGAILCQMLTGQPPYFGPPETLRDQARGGKLFGAYVLLDRCGVDQAIVLLAKHCLTVDPDTRPADAGALAAMMTQCLEGLQDRTRQLEMSRLAAEARLVEAEAREKLARKARRLARMLAVAGVMVAGLLAAWIGYYTNHRVVRADDDSHRQAQAVAVQQIQDALAEADARHRDARSAAGGFAVREAAAQQAGSACLRAEGVWDATPELPAGLRERLDVLKAQIAETERGIHLAVALEQWRSELFDVKGGIDPAGAARRCHEMLTAHGLDVLTGDAATAGAQVRQHDASNGVKDVLSDWLAVTPDATERHQLAAVLKASGNPAPESWVAALDAGDPDTLAKLADTPIPVAGVAVVAKKLIQANRGADAERLLAHAIARHPHDFILSRQLGTLLKADGKPADAIPYLTSARTAHPADPAVNLELGLALADAGRTDEALDVLRAAVQADPKLAVAHTRIGNLLISQGNADAARTSFAAAIAIDPTDGAAQLGFARAELGRGDLDAAGKAFQTASKSPAHAAAAHAGIGKIHLQRWEATKAVAQFRLAVATEPTSIDYRLGLIESLRVANDPAGALKEARAAAAALPKSAAAHRAVGELLGRANDPLGAAAAYKMAVKCDSADADTRQRLAGFLDELNDRVAAAAEYQIIADLRPKDVKSWIALAHAREKATDLTGAAESFRRALDLDPTDATIRRQLGRCLAAQGDESGLDELKAVVDAAPESGDARADLGHALIDLGRFRQAATTLREAADKFPAEDAKREAARTAARRATRLADLEERLPEFLAGSLTLSTPAAWAEVGEVCRRTKRYAAAARFFGEAAEGDPTFAAAAATCAALAGFGRGADATELSEDARFEWRKSALLAFRQSSNLAKDPALNGLREVAAMEELPAKEREAWKAIWEASR